MTDLKNEGYHSMLFEIKVFPVKTLVERDLGMKLSNDLKRENKAEKAAKSIITQSKNSFTYFVA